MEHQYPGAISGDENMLAELMLPDQVHNRKEDWTIFFLHRDLSEEEEPGDGEDSGREDGDTGVGEENGGQDPSADADGVARAVKADNAEDEGDAEGGEGPPLVYALNLVNTKHDLSAKRLV